MAERRMMLHVRLGIERRLAGALASQEDEEAGEVLVGFQPLGANVGVTPLLGKQRLAVTAAARTG